jgi:hypothetical protein
LSEVRCIGDVKSIEQLTPVKIDRFANPSCLERLVEGASVGPDAALLHQQTIAVGTHHYVRPKPAAKEVNRLAEGVAGVLVIQFGPKESKEGVAPVGTTRRGECQVNQEGYPFGLGENAAQLPSVGVLKIQRA